MERVPEAEEKIAGWAVPQAVLRTYARWWQIEIYLREVIYTELRTRYGKEWVGLLDPRAVDLVERDRRNFYMASADAEEVLAYLDTGALLKLIEGHWDLFEPILPPQVRWRGLPTL
jgi:hypothetical protein